jgi:hypothetical protein
MPALHLSEEDVVRLLPMVNTIEAEKAGPRPGTEPTAPTGEHHRTSLDVMPVAIATLGVMGVKNYTFDLPGGPRAYFLLFAADGELFSLMEAGRAGPDWRDLRCGHPVSRPPREPNWWPNLHRLKHELGVELVPVAAVQEPLEGADIVTTITTAKEPVPLGEWLAPGVPEGILVLESHP